MPHPTSSRRDFLHASTSLVGGAWLLTQLPAVRAAAEHAARAAASGRRAFAFLTPDEAADLEAIAAQIIPTDETPGAREAGVIHFIDRALDTFLAGMQEPVRGGLAEFNRGLPATFAGVERFAELADADQVAALTAAEQTPFFGAVRVLTVLGMFGHPSYGGNRDKLGWRLLGFDDRPAWAPPFGYYDRAEHGGGDA